MKNGNQIKWIKIGAFIFWQCSVISNMPRRRNIKFLLSGPDIPSIWLQFRQFFFANFVYETNSCWLNIRHNNKHFTRQPAVVSFKIPPKMFVVKNFTHFSIWAFFILKKICFAGTSNKTLTCGRSFKKIKKKEMKFQRFYDIRKVFGFFCNKTVYVST